MAEKSRFFRERLIDQVRQWPALWDVSHPSHKEADERDRCWASIAQALDITNCDMLRREWKILRDSLRQALKTRRLPGCRPWHFQERMAFLLPHLTKRPRTSAEKKPRSVKEERPLIDEMESTEARRPECRESPDSVELFFASVCVSARRLPPPRRRQLQRDVLAALHRAESDELTQ